MRTILWSILLKIRRTEFIHICLCSIVFTICISLFTTLWFFDSINVAVTSVYHEIGGEVYLDGGNDSLSFRQIQRITDYFMRNDIIVGVNSKCSDFAKAVNFKTSKVFSGENPYKQKKEQDNKYISENSVVIEGDTNIKLSNTFQENKCALVSGDFPNYELPGALISKELAEANALDIGSKLEVVGNNKQKQVFLVRGIYTTKADFQVTEDNKCGSDIFTYSPFNRIYTDLETAKPLLELGYSDNFSVYYESYMQYPQILRLVESVPLGAERFTVTDETGSCYKQTLGQLEAMQGISQLMRGLVMLIDTGLFIIFLVIYRKEYREETGILYLIGAEKRDVMIFRCIPVAVQWGIFGVLGIITSRIIQPYLLEYVFQTTKHGDSSFTISPFLTGTDYVFACPAESTNWRVIWIAYAGIGILALMAVSFRNNHLDR